MALEKITQVSGKGIHVPGADLDTDRIIPARFMKCVTFDGLGEFAFYDVRFDPETGEKTNHSLNNEAYSQATIMVTGENFGCGSSREHAPQSLQKYGFDAIIAESFAEIFFGNSTTLGLPCVTGPKADLEQLRTAVDADASLEISINLIDKIVTYGEQSFPIEIPESAREALTSGKFDPIQELLENSAQIEAVASQLAYIAQ